MSRRRGEFEHRTSIFEGAYRAWSHLGGLSAEDIESKTLDELDPLTNPIFPDPRLQFQGGQDVTATGGRMREYPYEPLPRTGLAHPYVQAILKPWLGPDADHEAIQLGLVTLRTWWQHRRRGESGSAVAALGTERMKAVVEGYTRQFFILAHSQVVKQKAQPPRGLHEKLKHLEKQRMKKGKKKVKEDVNGGEMSFPSNSNPNAVNMIRADLTNPNLSPLEKLHLAQQRQLQYSTGLVSTLQSNIESNAHRQGTDSFSTVRNGQSSSCSNENMFGFRPANPASIVSNPVIASSTVSQNTQQYGEPIVSDHLCGDPTKTPVVFVSGNGDIQIAMTVDGMTCTHCIKIVETVLKGTGNRSPISGLLDAVADRILNSVLIKIDKASNAKRIAYEAKRNLSMVGYAARAKEMHVVDKGADEKVTMHLGTLSTMFEVVANTDPKDVFDWTTECTCPDSGVLAADCRRHSQMNTRIIEAFNEREKHVSEFMAGCGRKIGLSCTCGPSCRCLSCPTHRRDMTGQDFSSSDPNKLGTVQEQVDSISSSCCNQTGDNAPFDFSQFQMGPPAPMDRNGFDPMSMLSDESHRPNTSSLLASENQVSSNGQNIDRVRRNSNGLSLSNFGSRSSIQNNFRNTIRGMSINSETTFGRAMSGLSVLSIDWENLEDFDSEVDHSAHINNSSPNGPGNVGSLRSVCRSVLPNGSIEPPFAFRS